MKIKKNVLKAIESITRSEIEKSKQPWPPLCTGILHQPKRPVKK